MPKTANIRIIQPSYIVGFFVWNWKEMERRGARQTNCEQLFRNHFRRDWKWKEQRCHRHIHLCGLSNNRLLDPWGERRGDSEVWSQDWKRELHSQLWESLHTWCHLPSKLAHSSAILNWISGDTCRDDGWLTGHYLRCLEERWLSRSALLPGFAWSFAHRCDDFGTGRSNVDTVPKSCDQCSLSLQVKYDDWLWNCHELCKIGLTGGLSERERFQQCWGLYRRQTHHLLGLFSLTLPVKVRWPAWLSLCGSVTSFWKVIGSVCSLWGDHSAWWCVGMSAGLSAHFVRELV